MKYIAYFDSIKNKKENRNYVLSATNKIEYICSAITSLDRELEIISPAWTQNKNGFYKSSRSRLNEKLFLKLFSTFGASNFLTRRLRYLFSLVQLYVYLLFNIKKGETVLVYHSVSLSFLMRLLKKVKKFRLILEVEEIYADVSKKESYRKSEYKIFSYADAFIFPTELLNEKINPLKKPYTIIHGTYQVKEDRKCKFNDGKIHCVYAGTFDQRKGGAMTAVATAEFLDEEHHIHIIGFGAEKDKRILLEKIKEVSKKTKCKITFDGLLSGDEYLNFIQSCHVGLSTQNNSGEFNDTSFPSKILSYMANGLRVVSIKLKVLEISKVNDLLYYYDKDTPEIIAKTIKKIDINDGYNSRCRINKLDKLFREEINLLLRKKI